MTSRSGRQETTRNWLARHFKPKQDKADQPVSVTESHLPVARPQTAPSTCTSGMPAYTTCAEPPLVRARNNPPPRPPRPDSNVMRDVNAWLDASMIKPEPPLMSGLSYWREGTFSAPRSADVRYAMPINRPPSPGQVKSFYRRAKKLHVRMPSLLRTRHQRVTVARQKQDRRRSGFVPLSAVPNGRPSSPQIRPLAQARSFVNLAGSSTPVTMSSQCSGWIRLYPRSLVNELPLERYSPAHPRFGESELNMERHVNAVFGSSRRVGDTLRPRTAGHQIPREDSMGNLSDAPTYFSGPPPPSYRSRAASILSTSSFGCVDGMSLERRQLSQQRAAQRTRGMKGKFRKLAQMAHITK